MNKTILMAGVSSLAMTMAVCSREAGGLDIVLSSQDFNSVWFYGDPVAVLAKNMVGMAYLRYNIEKRQVAIEGLQALQAETAND